jgi:uncharacterized membrane protein (DUF106 family)
VFPENPDNQSPKELIESLYKAFESFRRKMEDPSYIQLESAIRLLMENQNEMKNEIRELKKQLLNAVNKNTSFRIEKEKDEDNYEKMVREHEELMKFKSTATKILWGLLSGIGTIIIYYFTKYMGVK